MQGKGLSGRNWMRVNVLLLVSKKLSVALLIIDLLDPFAPKDLIALLSPLLWELLGHLGGLEFIHFLGHCD